jgi:serine O-acetyltransferase
MNPTTTTAMDGFRGDTWRQFGQFSWTLALRGLVLRPAYRALAAVRLCQGAASGSGLLRRPLMLGARVLHRIACRSAGIELPWQTSIAPGLAVTHGWGMVINHGAVIGRNVTLFHGVTIGWGETIMDDGSRMGGGNPVIEDDVWIGPHAVVAGPVTVGRGSRLGAGTCLFQSVPPQSIVVGNPGRVAKSGCPPDVINRYEPR